MLLKDVIKQLQGQGHNVTYRARPEGGLVITSINGVKFTAKKGNTYARNLVGAQISKKQAKHVVRASKAHKVRAKVIKEAKRRKLPIPPKEVKPKAKPIKVSKKMRKELRKAQSAFRKLPKDVQHIQGKPTIKRVRDIIKYKGKAEAEKAIKEAERYASGRIYSGQVDFLIRRIQEMSQKYGDDCTTIVNLIKHYKNNLKEEHFVLFKEELYKYENKYISMESLTLAFKQIIALKIFDISEVREKDKQLKEGTLVNLWDKPKN